MSYFPSAQPHLLSLFLHRERDVDNNFDDPWLDRSFSVLADRTAREIIGIVRDSPGITTGELCEKFPVSRFSIMRRLNLLADADILLRKKEGKTQTLFIDTKNLSRLKNGWLCAVTDD